MRKLSRFEKLGVVAAVVIACGYLYMKRIYEPQEKKLKATVAQLNKVIGEVNTLNEVPSAIALNRTLQKKKNELAGLKDQLKHVAVSTGAERELSEMLSRVSRQLAASGLTVLSLAPREKINDGLFDWNRYELTVTGGYFRYLDFLNRLAAMPDPVKLGAISLERSEKETLRITTELLI